MILSCALCCLACVTNPADSIRFGGRFFPRIVSGRDSGQAYSLLLPLDYGPAKRYPLLLILDPRGRALVPLVRFGPPAARLGFVVMSSYNSASDGPVEPNVGAVNAMLGDAWRVLSIDTTRVYLVGFSGTARFSWVAAAELRRSIRGIVQVGAGPAAPVERWLAPVAGDSTFAVFSATGTTDFNHDEVVDLDRKLTDLRIPHRTVVFSGSHEWAPAEVAEEAIEWLDLRHRIQNRTSLDSSGTRFRDRRLADLDSIRADGDTGEVLRRFGALTRDFPDDSAVAVYQHEEGMEALLRRAPSVAAEERRRIADDRRWVVDAQTLLGTLDTNRSKPTVDQLEATLGVAALTRRSRESPSAADRAAAERRLSWLFVNTVFYGPRTYRAERAWPHVITLLDLAHRIRKLPPEACDMATEALSQSGFPAAADRYPECAGGR